MGVLILWDELCSSSAGCYVFISKFPSFCMKVTLSALSLSLSLCVYVFFPLCLIITVLFWGGFFQLNSVDVVEVEHGVKPIIQDGYKWRLVLAYDGTRYAGLLL